MTDQGVRLFPGRPGHHPLSPGAGPGTATSVTAGSIVVAAAADSDGGDPHLILRAGAREASDDPDRWVQDLDRNGLIGQPCGDVRCPPALSAGGHGETLVQK